MDVAGDLHSAIVFISILGNADQQKRGFTLLARHRKRIQGLVGRAVVLKYTPALRFLMDDSVVRGNRVLEIIEELEKTCRPTPEVDDRHAATRAPAGLDCNEATSQRSLTASSKASAQAAPSASSATSGPTAIASARNSA